MMLMNGIRSEFKLVVRRDDEIINLIAKRKASKSPLILPFGCVVSFGKHRIEILEVNITISYDVVSYDCVMRDKSSITASDLEELINYGFKKVEE
jgi:hypothetical protein